MLLTHSFRLVIILVCGFFMASFENCSIHEHCTKKKRSYFCLLRYFLSETLLLEKKFGNRTRKPMLFIYWFSFQEEKTFTKKLVCILLFIWGEFLAVYWLLQPTPVFDESSLNKYQKICSIVILIRMRMILFWQFFLSIPIQNSRFESWLEQRNFIPNTRLFPSYFECASDSSLSWT